MFSAAIKKRCTNVLLRVSLSAIMACYRLVFAALQLAAILHCAASKTRVDRTREVGAKGIDVVLAAVNMIKESVGIFSDDYQFLRRMAAVETNDGDTFTFGGGGIWNVNKEVFMAVQAYMSSEEGRSTLGIDIENTFYVNWMKTITSIQDLDTPLYSALTVMIHIEISKADMTYEIPHDIPSQAIVWSNHFNKDRLPEEFTEIAEQLQGEGNGSCIQNTVALVYMCNSYDVLYSHLELSKHKLVRSVCEKAIHFSLYYYYYYLNYRPVNQCGLTHACTNYQLIPLEPERYY